MAEQSGPWIRNLLSVDRRKKASFLLGRARARLSRDIVLSEKGTSRMTTGEEMLNVAWGTDDLHYIGLVFNPSTSVNTVKSTQVVKSRQKRLGV